MHSTLTAWCSLFTCTCCATYQQLLFTFANFLISLCWLQRLSGPVSATDARGVSTRYYLTYRLSTVFFQSLQHDYRKCSRTSCSRSFLTLTCWPYAYFHENWDSTATAYCPLLHEGNLWEVFVLYYLRKSQLNMAYQQKVFYMKESKNIFKSYIS